MDQGDLLPAVPVDLVPVGPLVHWVRRVVREELDLSGSYAKYTAPKGQPPYHPGLRHLAGSRKWAKKLAAWRENRRGVAVPPTGC